MPKSTRSQPSDMTLGNGRTVGERGKGGEAEVSSHSIKVTRLISPRTRFDSTFQLKRFAAAQYMAVHISAIL